MAQEIFLNKSGLEYYDGKIKAHIKSQDDDALRKAKEYADSLAENYDAAGTAETKVNALANGQVKSNTNAIEKLNGNASTEGSVAKIVADAVAVEKSRAEGIENALRTDVDAIKSDYLKSSDKTEIQEKITTNEKAIADVKADVDAFFADADMTEKAKDTLKELQEYIASDETATSEMLASIQKNTGDIVSLGGRVDTAEGKISTHETAITELQEAISGSGGSVKDMVESAVATEKSRAEGIESGLDSRIQKLEAIDHEHANKDLLDTYKQTEVDLADAVTKKHSHKNADTLDNITSESVASWNAAESNAKSYTDTTIKNVDENITTLSATVTDHDNRLATIESKVGEGFVAMTNVEIDALFAE